MPTIIEDTISGSLKVVSLPDRHCINSWLDFLNALPGLVTVEVPTGASGVLVQKSEPSDDDSNKLWVRQDGSGGIIGLYAFQKGNWKPLYPYIPEDILWTYGNSNQVPEGFILIDDGDTYVSPDVVTALKNLYRPLTVGTGYAYYARRFVGF